MNKQVRPPALRKKSTSWMDRNWKWLIPLLVVGSGTVLAGFFVLIFILLRSSDAYKDAVATKSAGAWNFSTLVVEIEETSERFNLLE